jgi:hypothetical protein
MEPSRPSGCWLVSAGKLLKRWRQERSGALYWQRATTRSKSMPRGEVVAQIDLAVMTAGQAISRYRSASDADSQEVQLLELRINLEAALGMLDNVIPD